MNKTKQLLNLLATVAFYFGMTGIFPAYSQFAPSVGQPGTTAVHKDSSAIVRWANAVYDFKRGAENIANGWGTTVSYGDSTEAVGYAQGNSNDVVSLGDSGYITLAFPFPIMNGPGPDFAVFENSFSNTYLEFAHVEVSSNGLDFVRIPSFSVIHTGVQTGPYETTDTELIHNLAGKYRQGYGTPFDLEDIIDSTGLNLDSILFVRVVDVIGTIDPAFGSFDSQGALINDPYPTDFASGGFDLDGVAVINENNIYASLDKKEEPGFSVYPNPSGGQFTIRFPGAVFDLRVYDFGGRLIVAADNCSPGYFNLESELSKGVYVMELISEGQVSSLKLVIH